MEEERSPERIQLRDRSANYISRYLAKILLQLGCPKCLIQLSYAIGVAEPLSIYVDTYGTASKYEKNWRKSYQR